MSNEQFPFDQPPEADPFRRVRPVVLTAFDWLTVEAIWRSYQRYGRRAAIAVGIGLVFLWYMLVGLPITIAIALLSAVGAAGSMTVSNTGLPLSLLVAVGVTLYGGYRTYNLISDRQSVEAYAQNPSLEAATNSFELLHSRDDTVRATAANVVAAAMESDPGRVVEAIGDDDDVAYTLAELLHDDDEDVRVGATKALAFLSQVAPRHVAQYRDDVYAAMKYPNTPTQVNSTLTTMNITQAEPALSDESLRHVQPLCEHDDPDVREAAAMALGAIRNNRATELLRALMQDSNPSVRQRANEVHKQTR